MVIHKKVEKIMFHNLAFKERFKKQDFYMVAFIYSVVLKLGGFQYENAKHAMFEPASSFHNKASVNHSDNSPEIKGELVGRNIRQQLHLCNVLTRTTKAPS